MDWLKKNWKTNVIGLGLLVVAIGNTLKSGAIDMNNVYAALAAFGFIAAKDNNTTGT